MWFYAIKMDQTIQRYRYEYHIVFATKYRRNVIYNNLNVKIRYYVDTVGKNARMIQNYIKN
jgi:hypothetical protein